MNQLSCKVSNLKLQKIGFKTKDNLKSEIFETLNYLIQNKFN